jgi:hypothetical protein
MKPDLFMNKIIFTHGGGRFGNQLLQEIHLLAYAIKNEFNLINISFWSYEELIRPYESLPTFIKYFKFIFKENNNLSALMRTKKERHLVRILHLLCLFDYRCKSIVFGRDSSTLDYLVAKEMNQESVIYNLNYFKINSVKTLMSGQNFECWDLVLEYKKEIINNLSFNQEFLSIAKCFINNVRKKYDFVVGVFIRQTDYKNFKNGKYYFETKQYIEWIEQIEELYKDKNIAFVITSDQEQNLKMNDHYFFATGYVGNNGHFFESYLELSLCDLVLTPPSTFSMTASFFGGNMIIIKRDCSSISQDDILLDVVDEFVRQKYIYE